MQIDAKYAAMKNRTQENTSNEVVKSEVVVSEVVETPQKSKIINELDVEYVPYTEAQLNRRMEFSQFYSDVNCNLIMGLTSQYGPNTFSNIMRKVMVIADPDAYHAYYAELASYVTLNELIPLEDIVGVVKLVRNEMGLSRIKENLVPTCVSHLFQYFTIKPEQSTKLYLNSSKKVLVGYIPTFNLNCLS